MCQRSFIRSKYRSQTAPPLASTRQYSRSRPSDHHLPRSVKRRTFASMGGTPAQMRQIPAERREPGDTVALREIWGGRVWYARPAVVVTDEQNLTMFHVPPHVLCKEPVG